MYSINVNRTVPNLHSYIYLQSPIKRQHMYMVYDTMKMNCEDDFTYLTLNRFERRLFLRLCVGVLVGVGSSLESGLASCKYIV